MNRFVFALLLLFYAPALADNSAVPSKPFNFTPGTTAFSSQVNADMDALFTGLANIGTSNILASGVGTTQLAANSVTSAKLDAATVGNFLVQTGCVLDYVGNSAPTGWILADGKTIGNGSSGATERANADTLALYTLLYTSMVDAQAPVSTGRGASAGADFNANKTITIPDFRGRLSAGVDNMGGSTASRITVAGLTFDGTVNGNSGGTQNTTLSIAQMPAHSHTITDPGHQHTQNGVSGTLQEPNSGGALCQNAGTGATGVATTGITVNTTGSSAAHSLLQPTMVLYKIIKL